MDKVASWIIENWHKINTPWVYPIVREELKIGQNELYEKLKEMDIGKARGRKKNYRISICTAQVLKGKFGSFEDVEE